MRSRPEAEERLVEGLDELGADAGHQHFDERTPDSVVGDAVEPVGVETRHEIAALVGLVGEQDRSAHPGGPQTAAVAQQARERLAELAGAKRLVGEERQFPAVERLGELAVVVCEREPLTKICSELRANLVEARRLAAWLGGCDRQKRRDAERAEVE